MHVIAARAIKDYPAEFKNAATGLMTFLEQAEAADWGDITDVRPIYPHADAVTVSRGNDVVVFNACGNRYRLVTAVHFNRAKLYILRFMTHAEYDKGLCKDQL